MAGPSSIAPTDLAPAYDVHLTDGTDSVGLVVTDGGGNPRFTAERFGMPNNALIASQGESEWSNFDPQYMSITQDDWSGGRGLNEFDKDKSRYYDGLNITPLSDGVMVGPQLYYSDGFTTESRFMPGDDTDADNKTSTTITRGEGQTGRHYSASFTTPAAGYTAAYAEILFKKVGTPTANLAVAIYANSGGAPTGAALATATVTPASVTDKLWYRYRLSFGTPYAAAGSTTFHIVVGGATDPGQDTLNCWAIMMNTTNGNTSTDGASTWSSHTDSPYYRIRPTATTGKGIFFEYRKQFYYVTQPDSTANSFLWMNGDRGTADSNAGALTTLVDASKSWTADEWIGCVALITDGPGSEETQNWRTITDNDGTTLTVSPAWNVTHTTGTDYVILGSDKWTKVTNDFGSGAADMGGKVTDVAVANGWVYFARGDTANLAVIRYVEYNNAGAWASNDDTENVPARQLIAIRHPEEDTETIYGVMHNHNLYGTCMWKGTVPKAWGDLYYDLGVLFPTEPPWNDVAPAANVTVVTNGENMEITIAAGAGAGDILASTDLGSTSTVDISNGSHLSLLAKSTVAVGSAGDIELEIDGDAAFGSVVEFDFPTMNANEWTWCTMAIGDIVNGSDLSDWNGVYLGRLQYVTDLGAMTLYLQGGVHVTSSQLQYIDLPNDYRVVNVVAASGNQDDPRRNPWVITEGPIYEVQTQNSDRVVPIPLDEIKVLAGGKNGEAAGTNDVYLYWNLGRKFQRYYGRNLDDVGPDLDDGLPANRQGELVDFVSYPGKVFLAINGLTGNYSSIMELRGNAWHELYRSHINGSTSGGTIRAMGLQNIPGQQYQRLWVRMHEALVWIPVSLNPFTDTSYQKNHEGVIETGWIYAGAKSIKKAWKSCTIHADGLSALNILQVDYKIDDETDSWSTIASAYTSDRTEQNFSASTPPSTTGYRIKLRIRMQQKTGTYIKLKAVVINAFGIAPIKHGYPLYCTIAGDYTQIDRDGSQTLALGYGTVETGITLLDGWSSGLTPLTMTSRSVVFHNKTVILQDVRILTMEVNNYNQIEKHLLQLTAHDL